MSKIYYAPFTHANYKMLKKSKHFKEGGCSYSWLKDNGYDKWVFIDSSDGEIHGSCADEPTDIHNRATNVHIRYTPAFIIGSSQ